MKKMTASEVYEQSVIDNVDYFVAYQFLGRGNKVNGDKFKDKADAVAQACELAAKNMKAALVYAVDGLGRQAQIFIVQSRGL